MIGSNPFPIEAKRDPSHLQVMFLKNAVAADAVEALRGAVRGPEVICAGARVLYITYPDGVGASKLTGALIRRGSQRAVRRATGTPC